MDARTLRANDCFYTIPEIAAECLDFLHQRIDIDSNAHWIEPSAGSGSFLKQLPRLRRTGIDLIPDESLGIEGGDFLKWSPSIKAKQIITVGNPPFGKNSSLAVKFFNHAAGFSNCIAMIFPKTFRKDSLIYRLDRKFHLIDEMEVPKYSFVLGDAAFDAPCVFQIWEKQRKLREFIYKPKSHVDFEFCHKEVADFAIQRVGVNAGRIKNQLDCVSPNSHYFIKSNGKPELVLKKFEGIEWTQVKYNTAGNPSISMSDIVCLYEIQKERQ